MDLIIPARIQRTLQNLDAGTSTRRNTAFWPATIDAACMDSYEQRP